MNSNNHIFVSYKALGFVTNNVPISIGYYRKLKKPYVITCIGRSFHVYNCDKLAIVNISDSLPDVISCIKTDNQFIYVASGKLIYIFIQWKKVWKILDSHDHNITMMLPFVNHLISIDESSCMKVWTIKDGTLFSEMDLRVDEFNATAVVHPREYVNKILVGSRQGSMKLINLSHNKVIYSYKGWSSPITVLAQSQAVDVVGIGLKDGRIILHDLRCDETLMTFLQEWGEVTSLAFRTDQDKLMVSGSATGHIGVWDLEKRSLLSQLTEAHYGPVTGLHCLQNEPIMLTSSTDNSLKTWIFDLSNGGARLLHQRSGHAKPPTKVRFHGTSGNTILSSGLDSTVRSFSTIHDSSNKSLGRASYNKKQSKKMGLKNDTLVMSPILDFCSEVARQSDWDGLLACHDNEALTTTWNYNRSCMGQHKFKPTLSEVNLHPSKRVTAKCVTLTNCGNFGLVGYSNGSVEVFNMQSGLNRGSFVGKNLEGAHSQSITGVFVDEVNHHVATTALDGKVKFWDFKTKNQIGEKKLEAVPLRGILQRENNLLAIALGDFSVVAVDVETRHVVRQFEGHENDITDMAFGRQGRWLVTSSMDCCIRVFDLFSTALIDIFQLHTPATSIAVSPTDELLATTHANDLGIYLWYNRALHDSEALSFSSIDGENKPEVVPLPETKCFQENRDENGGSLGIVNESEVYASPDSIEDLLTCSGLPEVRWQSLIHYDTIMKKNKLEGEERDKIDVPFFIPTKPGLEFTFDLQEGQQDQQNKEDKKMNSKAWETKLVSMLRNCMTKEDETSFQTIRDYLLLLTPSAIEFELLTLGSTLEADDNFLYCFLEFMNFWARSNNHVDLYNAILNRFTKLHHEHLSKRHSDLISEIISTLKEKANAFSSTQNIISCLLSYQRSATL